MTFFLIAILAGVLTVVAPCILPLLPVVVGASEPGVRRISRRAVLVIGTLGLSVVLFTLLLKASTLLITIPPYVWTWFSGSILVLLGVTLVFPSLWGRVPAIAKLARSSNQAVGRGYLKNGMTGDVLMGFALGPVFSTCSPTYLYIIATVLPASFMVGLIYLLGFVFGLSLSLLLIAYFGQQLINRVSGHLTTAARVKQLLGLLLIVVGAAIIFGFDKQLEAKILESGYGATIFFEEGLLENFAPDVSRNPVPPVIAEAIPERLVETFLKTDWSRFDPRITAVLSGGPAKDGIPAIDVPTFVPLTSVSLREDIEAVVLTDGETIKVYPYNILTWHEIVNDTVADVPVAVTFCPLCGSAIVYERTLAGKPTTFGVSGFLIDSNMVMYDRNSESLWQQSTGRALAGTHMGEVLKLAPFQLMRIADVKAQYPQALVLSEQTGYVRDYTYNPYAGYEETNETFFPLSTLDGRYHPKTLFVVVRDGERVVAAPWDTIRTTSTTTASSGGTIFTYTMPEEVLTIKRADGVAVPFYFEMWFSLAAQHGGESLVVIDPSI